jgi:hypothetical protein
MFGLYDLDAKIAHIELDVLDVKAARRERDFGHEGRSHGTCSF